MAVAECCRRICGRPSRDGGQRESSLQTTLVDAAQRQRSSSLLSECEVRSSLTAASFNLEGRGSYWDEPSKGHFGTDLDAAREYGLPRRNFRHIRLHQAVTEMHNSGNGPMFLLTQEDTDETDWLGTTEAPGSLQTEAEFIAGEYASELMQSELAQLVVKGTRPPCPCYVLLEKPEGAIYGQDPKFAAVLGEECESTFGPGSLPHSKHYFMNKVYIRADLVDKVKVLDASGETVHTGENSSITNPRGAAWAAIELPPPNESDPRLLHVIIASFHLSGGRDDDCVVAENVAGGTTVNVASVRRRQLDKLTTLMMEVQRRLCLPHAIFLFGGDANSFVPQQAQVCQVGYAKMMLAEARVRMQDEETPSGNKMKDVLSNVEEGADEESLAATSTTELPIHEVDSQANSFARVQRASIGVAAVLQASSCSITNLAELTPLFRVPSEQEKIFKSLGDNEPVPLRCSSTVNGGQVDHFYYSKKTGALSLENFRVELIANKWWSLQPARAGEGRFQKGVSDHNAIMFTGQVVARTESQERGHTFTKSGSESSTFGNEPERVIPSTWGH